MLRHYLQWHILHRCNLHCRHCYQEDYRDTMEFGQMLSALEKYENYVGAHGYEGQINLTGGEPLLHPSFFPLARKIREKDLRLGVLSNGTLIDDKTAEALSELRPVFVQVSLDGPEEIHDRIRGAGSFARAVEGIDLLKKYGIRVLVSFTAMKENIASFKKLADVCKKHRVDKLWWDRVVTDDASLYLTTEEFQSLVQKASRLAKRYPFVSNSRALEWIPGGDCSYTCSAGKRLLIILPNGDLMACRRLPFVIGNIDDRDTLAEIVDDHPLMKKLAAPVFPEKCVRCRHFVRCGGGSRCVTYAQTGSLEEGDVNCWIAQMKR